MQEGQDVLMIFTGPHAYITPSWYAEHDVPTWNYAVAHVKGKARMIFEEPGLSEILREMTLVFEGDGPAAWEFGLPEDLKAPGNLSSAIVGFEITVTSFEGKFKLSQNRSAVDRRSVIHGLKSRSDQNSRDVADLMEILED